MKKYPNNGPTRRIQAILMHPVLTKETKEELQSFLKANKQLREETKATINYKLGK